MGFLVGFGSSRAQILLVTTFFEDQSINMKSVDTTD
jgi:hypothetical protein